MQLCVQRQFRSHGGINQPSSTVTEDVTQSGSSPRPAGSVALGLCKAEARRGVGACRSSKSPFKGTQRLASFSPARPHLL